MLRGFLVLHMQEHEAAWGGGERGKDGDWRGGKRTLATKGRTKNFLEAEVSNCYEEGTVGREFR